jgi:FkbM family methyltransferase
MNINKIYIEVLTLLRLVYRFKLKGLLIYMQLIGESGYAEFSISPQQEEKIYLRKGTSDIAVFTSVFAFNEFELNLEVPANGFIVDCGANIGISTVYFAKKYPQATIVALEPNIANFELCQKNTSDLKNVICLNAAIWSHNCQLSLQNPQDEDWAFRYDDDRANVENNKSGRDEKVMAFNIPMLLEKYEIERINILKIDIEGGETELFSSNPKNSLNWINLVDNFIVELHDNIVPGCSSAFYRSLNPFNFKQSISHEKIIIQIEA